MAPSLLDAVRALRWPARARVPGVLPGSHPARLRGPGGEFSEYRAYRQGDDPRRIDWRLLARSDRAFVRLADDHALLPTVCVVDASASMAFPADGPARHAKWHQAAAVAVGLAAVAHGAGDPVGLTIAAPDGPGAGPGAGARSLPPRSRRGVVAELTAALSAVAPGGSPPLAPAAARAPARCRLVLISDFLGDADGAGGDAAALRRAAAAHAAAGGEVYAVHVVAAEELELPRGLAVAVDPEAPRLRRPLDASGRAAYARAFAAWRDDLARAWRDAGAAYTLVRADEPPAHAVRRVVRGAA